MVCVSEDRGHGPCLLETKGNSLYLETNVYGFLSGDKEIWTVS